MCYFSRKIRVYPAHPAHPSGTPPTPPNPAHPSRSAFQMAMASIVPRGLVAADLSKAASMALSLANSTAKLGVHYSKLSRFLSAQAVLLSAADPPSAASATADKRPKKLS